MTIRTLSGFSRGIVKEPLCHDSTQEVLHEDDEATPGLGGGGMEAEASDFSRFGPAI